MRIEGIKLKNTRVVDATIITQNLAIWIDANNPSSYSGSGTTITDLSGNSYTQTVAEASYVDGGPFLGIKSFNCTADYDIQAVTPGPTLPTTGFTYLAWAKMNSSSADYRTLFRTDPDDHPLLIDIGTNTLGMWDTNGFNFISTGYDVSAFADVWALWAVTGNSSGQTFYINGVQVGTTAKSAAGNNHNRVGGIDANQSFGYVGAVRLYNGQLTQSEIQTIYNDEVSNYRGLQVSLDGFNYSGSGTTWSDNTGYSNNATLVNSPTYSDAFMGQFDFNGTNQYVNLGSAQQASRSTGFSLNTWVKFDDLTGWQTFVGQDTSQATSYGSFYFQKNSSASIGDGRTSNTVSIMIVNTSGSIVFAEDTTTVTTGVWYNFTATVSSSEIKLYKNGTLVNTVSNSDSMAPTTGDMIAGAGWYADAVVDYLNGQLAVVQYYNKVITDQEVSDLYNEFSYRYPAVANLQLQYLYADYSGTGTVIPDSSGNGYDGTMVNGLTQDGKSLVYNGTDDWIYTPDMYSTFNSTTHFTLEVWYNPTWTNPNEGGTVVSEASDITHSGWHYALVEHERAPFGALAYDYAGIWNGAYVNISPFATKTGWRQIVLSYDGTNGVSYTNAATPRTVALSRWTPWTNGGVNAYLLTIGRRDTTNQSGSPNYFKGSIGIVRLYNRALSSTEVLANYNSTKAVYNL
jgi:hypothetical protein